jgi:Flp pilus assembly protein TadD
VEVITILNKKIYKNISIEKGGVNMKASKHKMEDARRLMTQGKFKESIEAFTDVIKGGESSDVVFLSRGVAYLRDHQTGRAIDDFSEVVKRDDRNVRAHFYKGIAYMTKEDYKNAISEFDKTIELDGNHAAAFFARGTSYAQIGDDEQATKNIKTAITFSEASVYGLQETLGLWRTQFDRALSQATGEKNAPELKLTHDEYHKIMNWLEEGYDEEPYH